MLCNKCLELLNKKILLVICGGISAYKSLELIRLFKKKGAQIKTILTNNDLYNNSGLWSKLAYFNYMKDDDKSDLSDFLNRLRKAENSIENLNKIFGYTNADI